MPRPARPSLEAARLNAEMLVRMGREVRSSRERRGWSQQELARRAGISASVVGRMERGHGGGITLDSWQRVGVALDRPFQWDLAPDPQREPVDAGHLAVQELLLRRGRATGSDRTFEGALKPADAARSIDVRLRSDRRW